MTGGDECAAAFWQTAKISGLSLSLLFPCVTLGFAGEWLPTGKVAKRDHLFFCGVCNLVIGISFFGGGYFSAERPRH